MSLVDKLNEVNVGDLILLSYNPSICRGYISGFVADYSANKITLSNLYTREGGSIRDTGFFERYNAEKVKTFLLEDFVDYRILVKYDAMAKCFDKEPKGETVLFGSAVEEAK